MESDKEICTRVSQAIKEKGISAQELARQIGTNRVTATRWRNGEEITISSLNLWKLSRLLEKPMEWFVTGEAGIQAAVRQPPDPGQAGYAEYVSFIAVPHGNDGQSGCRFLRSKEQVPVLLTDDFFVKRGLCREKCVWAHAPSTMEPLIMRGDPVLLDTAPPSYRNGDLCLLVSRKNGLVMLAEVFRLSAGAGDAVLRYYTKGINTVHLIDECVSEEVFNRDLITAGKVVFRCHMVPEELQVGETDGKTVSRHKYCFPESGN